MRGSEIRSHLTFVHAVLEGRHEATVFADRLDEPSRVLVCGTSGFWFPFGAADAAFLADLDAPDVDNAWIYATTREWKSALDTLDVEPSRRIGYSSDRAAPASDTVPDGYEVRVIDRYWADRFTDGIDPWVLGIWGGAERFVNKSFGVAATHDDRVVAIGAACAIGGGEAEIEAGTDPDHRKKGIGHRGVLPLHHRSAPSQPRTGMELRRRQRAVHGPRRPPRLHPHRRTPRLPNHPITTTARAARLPLSVPGGGSCRGRVLPPRAAEYHTAAGRVLPPTSPATLCAPRPLLIRSVFIKGSG